MLVEIPDQKFYVNSQHLICIWAATVTLYVETSTQVRHFNYPDSDTTQAALNKIRMVMDN